MVNQRKESHEKVEPLVLTIAQFCGKYQVSLSHFYNLLSAGKAPATVKIGRKRLIKIDAASLWFDEMSAKTDRPDTGAK